MQTISLITSESEDKRTEYKITSFRHYNTGAITRTEYLEATQLPGVPAGKIKQLVKQFARIWTVLRAIY